LRLAKAESSLPADQVMHCLKDITRQLMFAGQFLEFGKFTLQAADLGPALHHQINQRTNQKITLGTEALPFALIGYPLITQDLQNVPDLLKNLPGQAPALLASS
jgi:hypothetical protein